MLVVMLFFVGTGIQYRSTASEGVADIEIHGSTYVAGGATSPVISEQPPADKDVDQQADSDRKECPRENYIDCMPLLSERSKSLCDPAYLRWVKEHCPDVEVVY